MPVPPAIRAMWECLFASHGYLGIGPLNSSRWSGFIACRCSLMGPFGYLLTTKSICPFASSSLVGVYGLMTGLSISAPLYFVSSADAIDSPDTSSLFGSAKRNFLVLWLISSTDSSFRSMKPWSPPRKAFWGAEAEGAGEAGTVLRSSAEGGACASGLGSVIR